MANAGLSASFSEQFILTAVPAALNGSDRRAHVRRHAYGACMCVCACTGTRTSQASTHPYNADSRYCSAERYYLAVLHCLHLQQRKAYYSQMSFRCEAVGWVQVVSLSLRIWLVLALLSHSFSHSDKLTSSCLSSGALLGIKKKTCTGQV